jgi:hypothetical protein
MDKNIKWKRNCKSLPVLLVKFNVKPIHWSPRISSVFQLLSNPCENIWSYWFNNISDYSVNFHTWYYLFYTVPHIRFGRVRSGDQGGKGFESLLPIHCPGNVHLDLVVTHEVSTCTHIIHESLNEHFSRWCTGRGSKPWTPWSPDFIPLRSPTGQCKTSVVMNENQWYGEFEVKNQRCSSVCNSRCTQSDGARIGMPNGHSRVTNHVHAEFNNTGGFS